MNILEVKVALQIHKSAPAIYEAIVNPEEMKKYFILYSSGRMEEGRELIWQFPEFEENTAIRVNKTILNKYISFYWTINNKELLVEIRLEPQADGSTVVRISEKGMENNEEGIDWLISNTEGWANFLACLKAWLEYGIHLRKGAFEFMRPVPSHTSEFSQYY